MRVKVNEIVIAKMDKSGKLDTVNYNEYVSMGNKPTCKDKVISWEKEAGTQHKLNGHVA